MRCPTYILASKTFVLSAALILCIFAFFLGRGIGRGEEVSPDGSWWAVMSTIGQINSVRSAISAYQSGYSNGATDELLRISRSLSSTSSRIVPASGRIYLVDHVLYAKNAHGEYLGASHGPQFSRTFGFYQAAITDFFVTHPKSGDSPIGDVMACLADTPYLPCDKAAEIHISGQ